MPFAFRPLGPTAVITAAVTAPAPVQVQVSPAIGSGPSEVDYLVQNAGTVVVRLAVDSSSASATSDATADATSTMLLPGTVQILRFPKDWWFTARAASGTATIYLQPGDGI